MALPIQEKQTKSFTATLPKTKQNIHLEEVRPPAVSCRGLVFQLNKMLLV